MTRRVVKPQLIWSVSECGVRWLWKGDEIWWRNYWDPMDVIPEKYSIFKPGDILYVRETWQYKRGGGYLYKADHINSIDLWITPDGNVQSTIPWRPSIHMPKDAARLFLRVTDVRVERLQDITEEQAYAEGCETLSRSARYNFGILWDSTIKKADLPLYGWAANPYVWCVSFEKISKEEASVHE